MHETHSFPMGAVKKRSTLPLSFLRDGLPLKPVLLKMLPILSLFPFWFMKRNNFPDHQALSGFGELGESFKKGDLGSWGSLLRGGIRGAGESFKKGDLGSLLKGGFGELGSLLKREI